jgi:glycosyltransferase involved in cell wall biosynthesis
VTGPLRVGIDARELQGRPTGTGRYLRNLLRVWTRHTDDAFFAYFSGPAPDDPALATDRVVKRPLRPAPHGVLWQEWRLPDAARQDGLDVFFSPAYSCPLRLDTPRVTAVHDLSFFGWPADFNWADGLRRRLLVGSSLRASSRILACSDFTCREIASFFPDVKSRLRHVPLGPDDDLAPPPPREAARTQLGLRGPLILSVGAILNRRCLPTLLRATARLAPRFPGLTLEVVGENRTHPRLDLEGLTRRLGIEGRVRFSGFLEEVGLAIRYAAADVAVSLSEYEGFGLPALEALSRGVPLVVSDRPSLSELFGGTALVVDPQDDPALAAALARVLSDPYLARELQARGRALASCYSWQETARLTREALLGAAGRGN